MSDIRNSLIAAGFDEAAVERALGSAPNAEAMRLSVRTVSADDPAAILVRLFVLGEAVEEASLPMPIEGLVANGLLEREAGFVRAPVRLTPHDGLHLAHDGVERVRETEYVTGVNAAALTLASLTVRQQARRVLDLGTGCGIQALLAARHADAIVATDINPRALRYTELNAELNDVSLDVRAGSLFEPVAGEHFDLIVSNPPFVVSPGHEYLFRDSGVSGDSFTRDVVRGAAAHLAEGGFATVLANWICRQPEDRWEPLVPWVEDSGCDALLLGYVGIVPFQYATLWNEPLRGNAAAFEASVERWLDYYKEQGIGAIGIGAVVLRRRAGANWIRGFDLTRPTSGAAGDHILRLFAAQDRLLALESEEELLAERFRPVDGHRLEQTLVYRGEYEIADVAMTLENSVGIVGEVHPAAVPLLFVLADDRPLGAALAEAGLEPDDALPTIRHLYERGFLELA